MTENTIDFINMVRRQIEEVNTYLHYTTVLKMLYHVEDKEVYSELLEDLEKRCSRLGIQTDIKELN